LLSVIKIRGLCERLAPIGVATTSQARTRSREDDEAESVDDDEASSSAAIAEEQAP